MTTPLQPDEDAERNEDDTVVEAGAADAAVETAAAAETDAQIRPTDIVFNRPHCGHGLCIDFRAAGLLTNCTECTKEVLVPIPEGMNIGDLDLSSEQTLGQLFYTRRDLARAEQRIAELEEVVNSLKERRSKMEKSRMSALHHCAELSSMCQAIQRSQADVASVLSRMLEIIAAEQQH